MIRLWQLPRYSKGLKNRLKTGKTILVILDQTAGPNGRQPYGSQIVKQLAQGLGCAYCTLSRHRQFAERYDSIQAYERRHPDVYKWKEICKILSNKT